MTTWLDYWQQILIGAFMIGLITGIMAEKLMSILEGKRLRKEAERE